jgi:dihydrofolate reductase
MRALTYYVATTLDGFIADPAGGFDFFPLGGEGMEALIDEYPETIPTHFRAQLGIETPNKNFDAVVMGRRTWEPSLDAGVTSSYQHLKQYVFSKTLKHAPDDTVTVVETDPLEYVRDLKRQDGMGIWLCGGGSLAGTLLPEIDELVLKINPIVVGNGIPLFRSGFEPRYFTRVESRPFDSGVTLLRLTAQR